MRIALIADTFPPLRTSGAVQMRDLARELVRQGHNPCVITPAPGLRNGWQLTVEEGVEVLRIRTFQTKDVNYVIRAVAEFLLPFLMGWKIGQSSLATENWDGVVWYSPNIFFGPLIWSIKRRCGCRSYLILRDIFPEWAVDAGLLRKGMVYQWLKLIERFQYSVADVIGVQSPSNLGYLRIWAKTTGRKVEVLNNWLSEFQISDNEPMACLRGLESKTVFVYAGNMGVAQGMDCLLALAKDFRTDPSVFFLFVGRGSEVDRLKLFARENGLSNVRFQDEIDSDHIPALLSRCQIGMLALDPRHKTHNIPGKFLAYLHAGLPVLARINEGNDLRDLIADEMVGRVSVGSESLEVLLLHAKELACDEVLRIRMGENGRKLGRKLFSSSAAAAQLVRSICVFH